MQFTNNMTFSPLEYAKLTDAKKTALYDVRKEARDKAPPMSISAAATAPAPAAAVAPAPTPVQRNIQAIGLVPTGAPAAPPADTGNDIHQILSQAATWCTNQHLQAPAATTTNDMFVYEDVVYQVANHNPQYKVNCNNTTFK
jgi:hypothetical protein